MRRRLAGLCVASAVLVAAITGCSAVGIATVPDRPDGGPVCDDEKVVRVFDGEVRFLTCAEAVAAAEASLGPFHWPITAATFDRREAGRDPDHVVCTDLECVAARVRRGVVRFEFWSGDPIEIVIRLDDREIAIVADEDGVGG